MNLHFGYVEHIVKCLKGEVDNNSKDQTIDQLQGLVEKEKTRIKTKKEHSKLISREMTN